MTFRRSSIRSSQSSTSSGASFGTHFSDMERERSCIDKRSMCKVAGVGLACVGIAAIVAAILIATHSHAFGLNQLSEKTATICTVTLPVAALVCLVVGGMLFFSKHAKRDENIERPFS